MAFSRCGAAALEACLGGLSLAEALRRAGVATPAYVYDLDAVRDGARALVAATEGRHEVAYALKANAAGSIVRVLAEEGLGADLVSGAELDVALACGIAPRGIFMSGVGKTVDQLERALSAEIRAIQAESVEELDRVAATARRLGRSAAVSLRLNPSVPTDTHAHVATGHDDAKFGIALGDVPRARERLRAAGTALRLVGVSTHVGSTLRTPEPYLAAARKACEVARALLADGAALEFIDCGGGFGIDMGAGPVASPTEFVRAARQLLDGEGLSALGLVVEPGRAVVGPHGVLVASVIEAKVSGERRWLALDAGMNDLIRPALYQARHRVEPLERPPAPGDWRVVGPVCESADDFGLHALGREPPGAVVLRDAGAYCFAMASEYNGRPLPAEVFISGGDVVHVSPSPGRDAWIASRLGA